MSLFDALTAIGHGRPSDALLNNARLEAGGGEAFGDEAILAHFRRHPLTLEGATLIEAANGFAAFTGTTALFGDLYGDHIGRLWRLSPEGAERPEAGVSVAFDPDLSQRRQDVFGRVEDHPALPSDAFDALLEAGRAIVGEPIAGESSPFRARAWLTRAFANHDAIAGLYALHLLGDEPDRRSAGFVFAAALLQSGTVHLMRDGAGEAHRRVAPWTPRLVA